MPHEASSAGYARFVQRSKCRVSSCPPLTARLCARTALALVCGLFAKGVAPHSSDTLSTWALRLCKELNICQLGGATTLLHGRAALSRLCSPMMSSGQWVLSRMTIPMSPAQCWGLTCNAALPCNRMGMPTPHPQCCRQVPRMARLPCPQDPACLPACRAARVSSDAECWPGRWHSLLSARTCTANPGLATPPHRRWSPRCASACRLRTRPRGPACAVCRCGRVACLPQEISRRSIAWSVPEGVDRDS